MDTPREKSQREYYELLRQAGYSTGLLKQAQTLARSMARETRVSEYAWTIYLYSMLWPERPSRPPGGC